MAALLVLPRYTRSARYLEPQAALVQFIVERWAQKDAKELDAAFATIDSIVYWPTTKTISTRAGWS